MHANASTKAREGGDTSKNGHFFVPPTLWQSSTAHFKIPPRQKAGNAKNIIGSRKHISNKIKGMKIFTFLLRDFRLKNLP